MVSKKEQDEIRVKVKHIVIIPLDMDKMNKSIDKSVKENIDKAKESGSTFTAHLKYEKNEFFSIRGTIGIVKGTNILVDDELVGGTGSKQTLNIYSETKENGEVKEFGIMPSFTTTTTIEELLKEYQLPEVDLETFMDDRFAYNSRIAGNIYSLIDDLKETKELAK